MIVNRGQLFILKTMPVEGDFSNIETEGLFVAIKNIDLQNEMDVYLQVPPRVRPSSFATWMTNNKSISPVQTLMVTATKTHDYKPKVYESAPMQAVIQHDGRGNFDT